MANPGNRQCVRGVTAAFEEFFLEADGVTPLVPIDKNYPQVQIEDGEGFILATGVAVPLGEGRWRFTWFVPVDATVTTCDTTYTLTWLLLTPNGQQSEKTMHFQVIDQTEVNPTERAYTYLTMQGEQERLFIRFRCPPVELSLRIVGPDGSQYEEANSLGCFTQRTDKSGTVFFLDTPALPSTGTYLVIWKSRLTELQPAVTSVQQLRVPESAFFYLAPSLRMALDKAQKKIGLAQAYSDPDLYEYLVRGVDLLNGTDPLTSWNLSTIPQTNGFHSFLLMQAMTWGLRAQFLSEGEMAFNFSGQTVTLDVDRSAIYDTMLGNIQEYLDSHFAKTKANWMRRGSVGHFVSRPYDLGLTSLVVPIQTVNGGQQQLLPLLSRLGIV